MTKLWSALALLLLLASPLVAASGSDDDWTDAVARMARVGACTQPSLSPDGERVAFLSTLSGVPQIWVMPLSGGFPELLTSFDDPVTSFQWSPDGAWLALSVAPGGGLNEQIYRIRPDGRGLERLTEGGAVNNRLGGFTHDGSALRYSSNREDPASLDGYLLDLKTRSARRVARIGGTGGLLDVSRDGRFGLVQRIRHRGDANLYLLDLDSGQEALLTPHEPPALFFGATFSPDGRTVYLTGNGDRDRMAFARIRLGERGPADPVGAIEILAARDDAEAEAFALSEDGGTLLLSWNVAGRSELAFFDLASGKAEPVPSLPGEIVGGFELSRDGRLAVLVLSGATRPADLWLLPRGGAPRLLTRSPHAGVDLAALVTPELVRFPADDGLELSGWLYRPPGARGPQPYVLSFHGGPESQERPAFNATYQALLSRGIGVLAPNVRGSSGFGKRFVNLDNGPLRVGAVRDIKACADFLVEQGLADPKRLGITGGSYGGYMTMAGLTEYPELFAAGAKLFGMVNFETFFAHTQPWMAAVSTVEYGDPVKDRELLRQLSPIHKLDRVQAPVLVLHGANDTNVPVVEAEQVVDTLKKRGVPVDLVLFPDEGHGFRKTPNKIRATVETVRFFERHLKGAAGQKESADDLAAP